MPGQLKRSIVGVISSPGWAIEIEPAYDGSASTSRMPASEITLPPWCEISITQREAFFSSYGFFARSATDSGRR